MPPLIPITRPAIGSEEAEAARAVVLSGWLTQGAEVAAFEREFAEIVGAPFACAVSSCTAALKIALQVVGIRPGDEVITVSHSFIAAANAIRSCGAEPVFVDIERDTFNLDPQMLTAALTDRTRAVLCVHQLGMPCDIEAIVAFAREHDLRVVEDAACAAGSALRTSDGWRPVGRPHGDIACFSFHPRKVVTTGEGGMLTTARAEWDHAFRSLRQHGMDVADTTRHLSPTIVFEQYPIEGFNYRMTDIQAAIGRQQLHRLPRIVERRRHLADRYRSLLEGSPIGLPHEPAWARSNWQSYCVRLPEDVGQKATMQRLLDKGIATRRGVMCAHREMPYLGTARFLLPHSEEVQDRCILLPLYPDMSDADQDRVVEGLLEVCRL